MVQQPKKNANIKISGMGCASCALKIEKSLNELEGVDSATVNLGTEEASVNYDPDKLRITDLTGAVEDAGYEVVNDKITIKVGSMSCAMCVKAIEDGLNKLDGVNDVNVNLASEKAYITYNPAMIGVKDFKKTIIDLGYDYLGVEGEETQDLEKELIEKDLKGKRNRIIVAFGFAIPIMILMFTNISTPIPMTYLFLIISILPFIYVSYPIFSAAYRSLKNRNLDMDVMYSMGIGVAYVSSVLGTFNILLTPEFMFYETALMLAGFLMLGRYLETRAKGRTSTAIKKLVGMQAKTATVLRDGNEVQISVEDVEIEDIIVVKPGEKIPADGIVVSGESYVDESAITGEPIPVIKNKGKDIVGGTINKNGSLNFKTTKVGKDTVLAQIIKLVETAQGSKPPVQKIADKAVTYFIPAVLTIALVSFVVWYLLLGSTLLFGLTVLISILVVACPCALGLATPTAITVGLGRGAELGILIKNGDALEISEKLTTILFDKTGTLTRGKPEVTDMIVFENDKNELLSYAASVESRSEHPLADAIVRKAAAKNLTLSEVEKFNSFGGKGVKAVVNKKQITIGNRSLFREKDIEINNDIKTKILEIEKEGKTVILIGVDNILAGIIAVADTIKPSTSKAISELKKMGLKIAMITGDNERTAMAIASQVGITEVISEVLPQDKSAEVKRLQDAGEVVSFVGDGINDAPALAQADVGIALGSGTDVAIESGDIVLIKDDIMDSVAGVQLSKKVISRVKQNLFWAFAYNVVLIPVAAGILYAPFGILFRPEYAGFAMAISSVTVVSLSLMLKGYLPPAKKLEKI